MRHGRLDHRQVWAQYAAGQLPAEIGRSMGRPPDAIYSMIRKAGGIRPAPRIRSSRALSLAEREEISRGLAAGASCRLIATSLGRAPSTITREINRNGGPARYRAVRADGAAWKASTRPKVPKLAAHPALAEVVAKRLKKRCRRSRSLVGYAGSTRTSLQLWVSHETFLPVAVRADQRCLEPRVDRQSAHQAGDAPPSRCQPVQGHNHGPARRHGQHPSPRGRRPGRPGALGGRSDLWHGRLRGGHVGGALDPVHPAGAYREDHLRNTSPPRSAPTSSRCPNSSVVR
jgi:DNA-binding CsgD family transcriptional regulator